MFGGKHTKRQNYDIQCKLGNEDYSENLQRVRIIASSVSFYHMFILEFLAEGENIIKNDLFGGEISLTITSTGQMLSFGEALSVKLTYINSEGLQLKNRPVASIEDDPSNTRPEKITIACIPTKALKNMITEVNKCFQEDFQEPPVEALKKVCEEFLPSMDTEIDEEEKNDTKLPKTYNIPRMPFSNFIRYIDKDDLGGLYKGPYVAFHDWEKFYCFSTKSRVKQGPEYTVTLLPTGGDTTSSIFGNLDIFGGKNFYTTVPIETIYSGPKQLFEVGNKRIVRKAPVDDLFKEETFDAVKDVMQSNTAASTVSGFINQLFGMLTGGEGEGGSSSDSKKTETYRYTGGNDASDEAIKTNLGTDLTPQSEIIMSFSGNELSPKKLLVIGTPVKFQSQSMDYMEYNGLYVAHGIDLTYSRKNSEIYTAMCRVRGIRANLKEEGSGGGGGGF